MSRSATKRLTPAQGAALTVLAGRNDGMGPGINVSAAYIPTRDTDALAKAGLLERRGTCAGRPVISLTDAGRAVLKDQGWDRG